MSGGDTAANCEGTLHKPPGAVLEDVGAGARVVGVEPGGAVTAVAVQRHGSQANTLTYRRADGSLGERVLFRADEAGLRLEAPEAAGSFTFDGDGKMSLSADFAVFVDRSSWTHLDRRRHSPGSATAR